ncbi:XRE family transcriptional regulator [Halomonas korlensis]|uniref:Phage repressor protein C, contains Cro/C1-type HTH and peptisase s24 domains n=1 Tax=Halomonas korlensis TaxID=463301 RepID=A0A1I7J3N9_9GAMM|nr:LexA family transcriptional regulator [Halomonas korlensis]SFU79770.1 Phage repressor protein C, contains Cro/C1-type HTH and peptisase s24 domains [Halomonas korlensis]
MHLNDRLKEERQRMSLSQDEFARLGGVSKRAQANYESGDRSPQADYLAALDAAGVDTHFVLTGHRETGRPPAIAEAVGPGDSPCPVPMYDIEAAAGAGRSFEGEPIETTLYFPSDQLAAQGLDPAQVVGIKVRGDSMDGTLADGDWVLVDRSRREVRTDGVFLLLMHGERRIKRVQRVAGGAWLLISDNPRYDKEMIKPQDMRDVEILGRCEIKISRIS